MKRLVAICLLVLPALGCTLERPGYKYMGKSQQPHKYLYQREFPPYQVEELPAPAPWWDDIGRIFVPI
jgi:hypothetical protein